MKKELKKSIALPENLPSINDLKDDRTWTELASQCFQEAGQEVDEKLRDVVAKAIEGQVGKERLRIVTLVLSNKDVMSMEYKHTIKHAGGLLTRSMVYAYSKAINDIFKLINTTRRNTK